MMADEALPCADCGEPTTHRVEINMGLGDTARVVLCQDCEWG